MQWSAILEVSDYRNFHISMIGGRVVMLPLDRCWEEEGEYYRPSCGQGFSDYHNEP